jgi:uncharacterized protein (DUF58 family)
MRSQRLIVSATVILSCAVGLWLHWAVLVAIGIGVGVAALSTLLLRFPETAAWTDLQLPARLSRNDEGAVVIGVRCSPRAGRWLSAAVSTTGERVFVDPAAQTTELSWPVDTSKRGMQVTGPTVLEAADPLGLRRRVFGTREQSLVLIVPKVSPVDSLESVQMSPDEEESRVRGSDAFESLREYLTGDPLKLVHWKASARAGELMVRRNVDTHIPRLLVILDVDAHSYDYPEVLFHKLDEQAFERSVDLAASLCWHACTPSQRVMLVTNGPDSSMIDVDIRDRDSALDWLATVQPCDNAGVGNHRLAMIVREKQPHRVLFVTGPIKHVSRSAVENLSQLASVTVQRVSSS